MTRDQPAPSLQSSPGLFALQVVGLEKAGCGFFVAAAGGWQRTPVCRALVRGGYRRLSEGTPLLRASGADLQLLLIPRSRSSRCKKAPTSNPKSKTRNRKPDQPLPASAATAPGQPRFLLFPQAVDWPESSLEPLHRSRALEELLPLTLLVRGDGDDFVLEVSDFPQVVPCETALLDRIIEALVRVLAGDRVRERPLQEPVEAEVTRLIHPRGRSLLTGVLPKPTVRREELCESPISADSKWKSGTRVTRPSEAQRVLTSAATVLKKRPNSVNSFDP